MRERTRTYLCLGKRRWALGRVFSGLTAKPICSLSLPFLRIEIALLHLEEAGCVKPPIQFQPLLALPPPLPPMNEMVKPDTSGRRREGGLIHASIL